MRTALWMLDRVYGRRLAAYTSQSLRQLTHSQTESTRAHASALLRRLSAEEGPQVQLGQTSWEEEVSLPLRFLTAAHGIITGGSGAGKSRAALLIIQALLRHPELEVGFGLLDAKGEVFEATICLLAQTVAQLPPKRAQALIDRLVIVDLSCPDPISPYNIAWPWEGCDLEFFVNSRVDTLQGLFLAGDDLSIRGVTVLRHLVWLLAELRLPFGLWERVLGSEAFRNELLTRTPNRSLRDYFLHQFPCEGKSTVAAVRVRLASTLFGSTSLRLALSGKSAPDFRKLQDQRKIVLINCAGSNIPRSTAHTLQALLLSDIRAGVFSRRTQTPFPWLVDESQCLFRTHALRENLDELLRMARSFCSFFVLVTQNLAAAAQDTDMLDTLRTNVRWSLSFRSSPRDASFLQPAFPITGRMRKPQANPYGPAQFCSLQEERAALLEGMASLPDRVGWLWLKSLSPQAIRITTSPMELPPEPELKGIVSCIRSNASIGHRVSRETYLEEMARQEQEWVGGEANEKSLDLTGVYQQEQELVQ